MIGMEQEQLIVMAENAAIHAGIDPVLVCCVCEQESSWNPRATRFEAAFKERYVDPQGRSEPEATQRATSWGLMQVMGEVARELGYVGPLMALLDPLTGLSWGCRKLFTCLTAAHGNNMAALLRYNGGSAPEYASKVLSRASRYRNTVRGTL